MFKRLSVSILLLAIIKLSLQEEEGNEVEEDTLLQVHSFFRNGHREDYFFEEGYLTKYGMR
jgi:hypothetical protein